MPTLSLYSFERADVSFGGPFVAQHTAMARDGFALDFVQGQTGRGAALAIGRPDDEDVVDLADMYNNFPVSMPVKDPSGAITNQTLTLRDFILRAFDEINHSTLRDPKLLRSTPLNRMAVPSFLTIPPDAPNQVITELHIDFHINTRGDCYTHEGTLVFYVQFLLPTGPAGLGTPSASAIATWFTPDTNPDVCAGEVNNRLNHALFGTDTSNPDDVFALVGGAVGFLNTFYFQNAFKGLLANVVTLRPPSDAASPKYHRIYGLPGDGRRVGQYDGDADQDFSIGLERLVITRSTALHFPASPL